MKTANGISVVHLANTANAVFESILDRPRMPFPGEMWQEVAARAIGILDNAGDDGPMDLDTVRLAQQLHDVSNRWQNPQEEFEKLIGREQIAWEAVGRTMAGLMQMTSDEFPRVEKSVQAATQWAERQMIPQEV